MSSNHDRSAGVLLLQRSQYLYHLRVDLLVGQEEPLMNLAIPAWLEVRLHKVDVSQPVLDQPGNGAPED